MPIIQAYLLEGRSDEAKAAFIAAVTEAAHSSIGSPIDSVSVIITEIPAAHFGVGGEPSASCCKVGPHPNCESQIC